MLDVSQVTHAQHPLSLDYLWIYLYNKLGRICSQIETFILGDSDCFRCFHDVKYDKAIIL